MQLLFPQEHRISFESVQPAPDLRLFPHEPQGRIMCIQAPRRGLRAIQDNLAILPVMHARRVYCLDGVNAFNPYPYAQLARRTGRGIAEVLDLVRVSRAFTIHQLQEAVERLLPPLTAISPTPLVAVLGLEHLFLEESLPLWERRHVLGRILKRLGELKDAGMPVLITFDDVDNGDGHAWAQTIREHAEDLARLEVSENGTPRLEWDNRRQE